ncbi:MAG: ATP-dependent DNA helicase RecG [Bacteroidales bacterium]|nr:ATP-dependent DNA helicase RecG [Bacteroidales bacterium]
MSHILDTPINFLKGVGEQKAELLKKELGIFYFRDLLHHYPFRYVDKSQFYKVNEIKDENFYYQLKGYIRDFQTIGHKQSQRITAVFYDETGEVELLWFKGLKWIKEFVKSGQVYTIYGKPKSFRGVFSFVHPELEIYEPQKTTNMIQFESVYNSTEKLKANFLDSKGLRKLCYQLFEKIDGRIEENLSAEVLALTKFPSKAEALRMIHFPQNQNDFLKARQRLVFEEFFFFGLKLLLSRNLRDKNVKGFVFESVGDYLTTFYKNNLPFELTNAQKRVIKEMRKDMATGRQMNRLLQGDVGSGKTLVALMLMLIAADNGFQSCLMAPTEILAQQHFNSFQKFLANLGIQINLLTGSTKAKERREIHDSLLTGKTHILIGTHALIESAVQFNNLGFVVIDEQHRFGVAQRAKLWQKNSIPPHVLVMTATPIPRTLAMTVYGDLDVSQLDELPPGRKPIKTHHVYESSRLRVFEFIRKTVKRGKQVYVVYPLIEESETLDLNFLMDGFESISRSFPLPEYAVSIVHGKMKAADKEYEMMRFAKGETDIMVATTVIEVGVDVPNASVMVIENAERFGLAQLHQLRGRVGRGDDESNCILITSDKISADGLKRVKAMTDTNDGFRIAELDLTLRGGGDIQGLRQSGMPEFKIADIFRDEKMLKYAKSVAESVLAKDNLLSLPHNAMLLNYLKQTSYGNKQWSRIS